MEYLTDDEQVEALRTAGRLVREAVQMVKGIAFDDCYRGRIEDFLWIEPILFDSGVEDTGSLAEVDDDEDGDNVEHSSDYLAAIRVRNEGRMK